MARREGGRTTAVQDASLESRPQAGPPGFGVRQSSGALARAREEHGRNHSGRRTPQVGKAVEDYRTPRRFARIEAVGRSARFWTAPVLWRFEVELPKGVAETKRWTHASHWGKAVEDYRSPRRFATVEGGGKSARFWSAPVLWRFSSPFRRGIEVVGQIELIRLESIDRLDLRG